MDLMFREEQEFIDRIISGEETGHYYLLIGEKVTTSRRLELMARELGKRACY
jgi:hypothetical protein